MTHPLVAQLRSRDPAERRDACLATPDDPAAVLLVGALAERLGDPIRAVWRAAVDALVAVGRRDRGALESLREALASPDARTRCAAALAGARLAPHELRWLPRLVEGLGSDDGYVRWGAARALVEMGRGLGEVRAVLLGVVQADPSPVARRMASFCVRDLGGDDPRAAEALLAATRDPVVAVRRAALSALAALLAPAPAVEARLLEVLGSDADAASRRIAAAVLGGLAANDPGFLSAGAREALAQARESSPDPDLRRAAARALGGPVGSGPAFEQSLPTSRKTH